MIDTDTNATAIHPIVIGREFIIKITRPFRRFQVDELNVILLQCGKILDAIRLVEHDAEHRIRFGVRSRIAIQP